MIKREKKLPIVADQMIEFRKRLETFIINELAKGYILSSDMAEVVDNVQLELLTRDNYKKVGRILKITPRKEKK